MDFHSLLLQCAKEEGFPIAGAIDIASVLSFDDPGSSPTLKPHVERYDEWLANGYDGAMSYLRRGRDRRADPRIVFPEAQSVFCVAMPYPVLPAGSTDARVGPRYARYLRRQDYHDEIALRLERVMQAVAAKWSPNAASAPGMKNSERHLSWKVCVDTSAVLERSWAALAGLGWIGKNSLLIHPQYGSYLFIGEVLVSERTGQGPKPIPNYCGNCTRCLNACPTQAFTQPKTGAAMLDSNKCIAYWTLEKRGELSIDETQKRQIGTWIAGCDVCQEVCPFNTKPTRAAKAEERESGMDGATSLQTWRELLEEPPEQYKARIKDSSLSRVKPAQFSRNLAMALGNAILATQNEGFEELREQISSRAKSEEAPEARVEWVRCLAALDSAQSPKRMP